MSYKHYNPNPDHSRVGDCTVRAIAQALETSWEDAYLRLCAEEYRLRDMPSADAVWGSLLASEGFRKSALPDSCPICYTVRDFARDHPEGVYVVAAPGHVLTVRDGDWYDSWDSGDEALTYFFRGGKMR